MAILIFYITYIGNFNKAWHERIEVESTDNENILNHPFKRNKKSKTVETSDSSENEGKYLLVPQIVNTTFFLNNIFCLIYYFLRFKLYHCTSQ